MTKTQLLCDWCRSRVGTRTINVFIDRRVDAAGSLDGIQDSVDLCANCMAAELEHAYGRYQKMETLSGTA